MRTYLNDNWQFFKQWSEEIFRGAEGIEVRVPHSNVVTPFNNFDESVYQFVSGYKRNLRVDDLDGKTFLLTFDGVAHYAEVYVNGSLVCSHKSGYTAFTCDITDKLTAGDNVIVVKVDSRESLNQPPFGYVIDYLTYGGIYRDVYLDVHEGAYVSDVAIIAEPNKPVCAKVKLKNFSGATEITARITDGKDTLYSSVYTVEKAEFTMSYNAALKLWDIEEPNVYVLQLQVGNEVYESTFGVRSAEFKADGFYLNGRKIKLVGLNRHQSYPYVGYAMPESMQRLDAQILKNKLGLNLVRTSHYPQSQYFVDECDKLGLMVFTEIPGWQHIGDEEWQNQAVENVREMVEQYRNHPSIVLWGVRINESQDNDKLYKRTNALAHELDSTRQTGGVRYIRHSHFLEDVYTFNDFNRNGASDRNGICLKNAPYLVTEYNGHMFPTKTFDDSPHRLAHALRYAKMLDDVFAASDTSGCVGWCMFDYNTHKDFGSGDRICYHGVTDMFRNSKWASGVFSAALRREPFLDVCFTADIGDYPEGQVGDMYCLTNADYIKVYRGGVFVKKYTHADSPYQHMPNPPILIDDLIGDRLVTEEGIKPKNAERIKKLLKDVRKYGYNFLPTRSKLMVAKVMMSEKLTMERVIDIYGKYDNNWGGKANEIVIEAYREDKLIASKKVGSFYEYGIEVTPSATTLQENTSYDVAAVQIVARDQNGAVCPYVNKAVTLKCEGVVELIGESTVALAGGMFGAYVKTTGKKGKGALYVDDIKIEFEVV